jgi:hypothetical protein
VKSFFLACLMLIAAVSNGQAQLSDAQIVSRMRERPAFPQEARPVQCANKPAFVAGATVGGALVGWFGFLTLGLGLMAADHGEVYQRSQRRWMLGGAAVVGGAALVQSITHDCLVVPPRRERRDSGALQGK